MLTTCPRCGRTYEACCAEHAASPDRLCLDCIEAIYDPVGEKRYFTDEQCRRLFAAAGVEAGE